MRSNEINHDVIRRKKRTMRSDKAFKEFLIVL